MKNVVNDESLGEITYEESFVTGGKKINVNGEQLEKVSRKEFKNANGDSFLVKGSFLTGVKLVSGDKTVTVTPTVTWYEILLAVLPFILIMVWGNTVALCRIIPVVGGAIGGAISGGLCVISLFCMWCVKPFWTKLLIGVAFVAITFGVCCGIGFAIIGAIS